MHIGGTMRNLLEQLASREEQLLVASTIDALRSAGLVALEDSVRQRLLSPMVNIGRVFQDRGGFQPFIEILLVELRDIAAGIDARAARTRRGLEAIALAGF